jgi:Tol biopolymer transport system component
LGVVLVATVLTAPAASSTAQEPPPAADRIAFASTRFADGDPGVDSDIVVMDGDGTDAHRFTFDPGGASQPSWSPDATAIMYDGSQYINGNESDPTPYFAQGDVVVFDGVTRRVLLSAHHPVFFSDLANGRTYETPGWSPDGLQFGFTLNARFDGPGAVDPPYSLVQTEGIDDPGLGSDYEEPVSGPPSQGTIAWSPDSSEVVFQGNSGQLIVAAADDSTQRSLGVSGTDPDWSPDGQQIAYASGGDIFTIPAAGGTATALTTGAANDGDPTWSPDGERIAFETDRAGNSEIFAMGSDGSSPVNLTQNAAADYDPDWSGTCPESGCPDPPAPTTPPDAPTDVALGFGPNFQFAVAFSRADTGPWAYSFTATQEPGDHTSTGTYSPLPLPAPIHEGITYTFSVTAENEVGASPPGTVEFRFPCGGSADNGFVDVPAWADPAVTWLVVSQYGSGFPNNRFRPSQAMTRGQVARMLYRFAQAPDVTELAPNDFDDVGPALDDVVTWVSSAGIMVGSGGHFRPGEVMLRGQLAVALHRLAGSPPTDGLPPHGLTDVPPSLNGPVKWVVHHRLLPGYADRTFRPRRPATRAMLSVALYRDACDPA